MSALDTVCLTIYENVHCLKRITMHSCSLL